MLKYRMHNITVKNIEHFHEKYVGIQHYAVRVKYYLHVL